MNGLLVTSIVCTISLAAGTLFFGSRKENYSALKHSISELGETGARHEKAVGYGLFLPVGLMLLAIALVTPSFILKGLSACIAAGYLVAAFFPCDAGSPAAGSFKQTIHNIGGFAEYAGAAFFLMRASENDLQLWFIDYKIIALMVIGCMIGISVASPIRGLLQRMAEVLLFGSVIAMACSGNTPG